MSVLSVDSSIHGASSISIQNILVQNDRGAPPFYATRITIEDAEGRKSTLSINGQRGEGPLPLTIEPEK
jgi:hypothetical protein